jgi:hypothetical protein
MKIIPNCIAYKNLNTHLNLNIYLLTMTMWAPPMNALLTSPAQQMPPSLRTMPPASEEGKFGKGQNL